MDAQQITVRRIGKPDRKGFEGELDWFCRALGMSEQKDDLGAGILKEILRRERKGGGGIRSISISRKMRVTRGGAVYHLNKLMQTGLIVRRGREYGLRGQNLSDTVEEIEQDMARTFRLIRRMAVEIDGELGIRGEYE
jgi:hypothetical protein